MRGLWYVTEELARRKLGLSAEYQAHSMELVPHRPHEWSDVIVKLGVLLPPGPWPKGIWADDRHRAIIKRADTVRVLREEYVEDHMWGDRIPQETEANDDPA